MGARLVDAHHSRIAGDVSANDGCEASLHILRRSRTTIKPTIRRCGRPDRFRCLQILEGGRKPFKGKMP
jgi:hypothetical protein